MVRRIILLIAVIFILTWLVIHRYEQLRIEALNTRFFNNAKNALTLSARDSFDSEIKPVLNTFKHKEGNLLPFLSKLYPDTLPKALIDPFLAQDQPQRFLQLRYGFVNHNNWMPPAEKISDKPVWFIWSNGATGEISEITETVDADSIRSFHFLSAPYDPTNGHNSVGYLYADSMGAYVGRIK
jgi:hypothetical protein